MSEEMKSGADAEASAENPEAGYNQALIRGKQRIAARGHERLLAGGRPADREVEGSGAPNNHGMPKLPPGQHEV